MGRLSNISKTLYSYFNNFAPSYIENSVPIGTNYPYITYSIAYDDEYKDTLLQARIWTKSSSLQQVVNIADNIDNDIKNGKLIKCVEGGNMWLKSGSPFQQFVSDEDINIKTIYINIISNYLGG